MLRELKEVRVVKIEVQGRVATVREILGWITGK